MKIFGHPTYYFWATQLPTKYLNIQWHGIEIIIQKNMITLGTNRTGYLVLKIKTKLDKVK